MKVEIETWLILALALGVILIFTRFAVWGKRLLVLVLAFCLVVSSAPVGEVFVRQLEARFPRTNDMAIAPKGIIVLGGIGWERGEPALYASAARPLTGLQLALRHPRATLVISGGTPPEKGIQAHTEAEAGGILLVALGFPRNRILLEPTSRNTAENARFTAQLIQASPSDCWILVTSAFHMPRAIGAFRQAGINPSPYPVDFRTPSADIGLRWAAGFRRGMDLMNIALHEWVGLVWYRIQGWSQAFFPKPHDSPGACRT